MAKVGAPTDYSKALAKKICDIIANSNKGLTTISKEPGMPQRSTIHDWLTKHEDFADMYARAKQDQADFLAEEMLLIADTCLIGEKTKTTPKGVEITKGDMVERSKLMVDTRKWVASKLKPKSWGDKLDVTTGGLPIKQSFVIAGKEIEF